MILRMGVWGAMLRHKTFYWHERYSLNGKKNIILWKILKYQPAICNATRGLKWRGDYFQVYGCCKPFSQNKGFDLSSRSLRNIDNEKKKKVDHNFHSSFFLLLVVNVSQGAAAQIKTLILQKWLLPVYCLNSNTTLMQNIECSEEMKYISKK